MKNYNETKVMETLEKTKLENIDPVLILESNHLIEKIEMFIKMCNLAYFGVEEDKKPFILIPNNDKEVLEILATHFKSELKNPSSVGCNYYTIYVKDACYDICIKSKEYEPVVTFKLKD